MRPISIPVTGGGRVGKGRDALEYLTIELPATTDCDAQGAICTGDGRRLSNRTELTVSGPGG